MEKKYCVRKFSMEDAGDICVEVPGSKSITNRALLLAALSARRCVLKGVLFSDDSRAFLDSLLKLGFSVSIQEEKKQVSIQGGGGKIPLSQARLNVRSAGTAARFLTVMLAFAGGDYEMDASPQMCRRPMQPLLDILREAGAEITYRGEPGHFPFRLRAKGLSMDRVTVDTKVSSQFASALLMAGVLQKNGLTVNMQGDRKEGAYIRMTLAMMRQFGICVSGEKEGYHVPFDNTYGLERYDVEPDVSAACYFYAMAPLLRTNVIVKGVQEKSIQGDIKFLEVLKKMGCETKNTEDGLWVQGRTLEQFPGVDISMKDFSDQVMTLAAIAPFASSPTVIREIGHIRFQESDRINAVVTELSRMGICCGEKQEVDGIFICPGAVHEAEVETYEDHRMAMAFTLTGMRAGGISILNPECCGKTFENYFQVIDSLYKKES